MQDTDKIKQSDVVALVCEDCGIIYEKVWSRVLKRRENGFRDMCTKCTRRYAIENLSFEMKEKIRLSGKNAVIRHCANMTKEQLSERGRKGGAGNTTNLSVKRQWESIKADPNKMKLLREQRGKSSKAVWENYTPEQKSARVIKMLGNRKVSVVGMTFLNELRKQVYDIEDEVGLLGFVADGFHRATNTVILFHGDFWHCNPRIYKDSDKLCKWLGRTVGEQWKRDKMQLAAYYSHNYHVVVVWEYDWNKNPLAEITRVSNMLAERLAQIQ